MKVLILLDVSVVWTAFKSKCHFLAMTSDVKMPCFAIYQQISNLVLN